MFRISPIFSLTCLFVFLATIAVGQVFSSKIDLADSTQQHLVVTKRGDRIVGRIQKIEGTTVSIAMNTGNVVSYAFSEIEWVGLRSEKRESGSKRDREFDEPRLRVEPALNGCENLLFSPTAFNFPKGTGEYRNLQVLVNTVDYGVSDHFSVGGGLIVPFIFVARFKATVDYNEILHLGAGTATYFTLIEGLGEQPLTHLYGVVTVGKPKAYLNVTAGYGFTWGGSSFDFPGETETVPLLASIGGSVTVADRFRFMVDIAYLKGDGFDDLLPTASMGWVGRVSRFEVGLFSIVGFDSFAMPVLSYARRF